MSDSGDGKTDAAEMVILVALTLVGAIFLAKPALVTVDLFVDFVTEFPDPSQLGPFGNIIALVALLFGSGGLVRKKIR